MTEFTKHDDGKPQIGLWPTEAIEETAHVLTAGARKYGAGNWIRGADYSRYADAAMRHLWAWNGGEDVDPETGRSHLAHAMCCLAFLIAYQARGLGRDDRAER